MGCPFSAVLHRPRPPPANMTAIRGALVALVAVLAAVEGASGRALPAIVGRQGGPPPGVAPGATPPPGVGGGGGGGGRKCPNPATVPALDVAAYTGRWYQIGVTAEFAERQEDNKPCVTADYRLTGPTVEVINCKQDVPANRSSGAIVGCAQAVAFPGKKEDPGKLGVQFPGAPFPAPYWVIDLAGSKEDGYRVAVVYSCTSTGSFFSQGLFLLSRTPKLRYGVFEAVYWYVRVLARGIRFQKGNEFKLTPQGKSCTYRGDEAAKVVFQ